MGACFKTRHAMVSVAGGRKSFQKVFDRTRMVLDDTNDVSALDTSRGSSPENVGELYLRLDQRPA